MKKTQSIKRVLSIAGFDGTGEVGTQADIKTISALGCYATTVLTAMPTKNTLGLKSLYDLPQKNISEQLSVILDDIGTDAVKIGMLHRIETVKTIIKFIKKQDLKNIVLDPVFLTKQGEALALPETLDYIKAKLFPLITVLTPNLEEASVLLNRSIKTEVQMERAAIELLGMGLQAVVIKGGRLNQDQCCDCLCLQGTTPQIYWFTSPIYKTTNTQATGCTFSSAIASMLAKNIKIHPAVEQAKRYISQCLESGAGYKIGKRQGPLQHF